MEVIDHRNEGIENEEEREGGRIERKVLNVVSWSRMMDSVSRNKFIQHFWWVSNN